MVDLKPGGQIRGDSLIRALQQFGDSFGLFGLPHIVRISVIRCFGSTVPLAVFALCCTDIVSQSVLLCLLKKYETLEIEIL